MNKAKNIKKATEKAPATTEKKERSASRSKDQVMTQAKAVDSNKSKKARVSHSATGKKGEQKEIARVKMSAAKAQGTQSKVPVSGKLLLSLIL